MVAVHSRDMFRRGAVKSSAYKVLRVIYSAPGYWNKVIGSDLQYCQDESFLGLQKICTEWFEPGTIFPA